MNWIPTHVISIKSRWNKEGECEKHTLKFSGAKTGEYLYDLGVETDFFNKTKSTNCKRKRKINSTTLYFQTSVSQKIP